MLVYVIWFARYLEEFERKIPRAEMLELQVFFSVFTFSLTADHCVVFISLLL